MAKIRAFSEVDSFSAKDQFEKKIKKEINSNSKKDILGLDEDEYLTYLIEEFKVEPIVIYSESEKIEQPRTVKEKVKSFRDEEYYMDVYYCTIQYKYSGSTVLFKVRPSRWAMTSYELIINQSQSTVSFTFRLTERDPEKFRKEKEDAFKRAFTNVENVNQFATEWNSGLANFVSREFKKVKSEFLKENDFFAAINVSTNKNTESIFTVPVVKKIDIPQPRVDKNMEFASVPSMSQTMYSEILKVTYDAGKSMEKKPSLYKEKDEEGLRDQFLFILETRYEGVTATGETFNKRGKTDILLKYAEDGSNLFVAECKFWKGPSEFMDAINQLFDRYLTWRDSKVALMFFVTNKDFSKVLESVKKKCNSHEYYKRENGESGESSFSYLFSLPNDRDKDVYLEVMLFHYDQ